MKLIYTAFMLYIRGENFSETYRQMANVLVLKNSEHSHRRRKLGNADCAQKSVHFYAKK